MLKLFDVKCDSCGYTGEVLLEGETEDWGTCPECGEDLHREFTKFNFKLKYNPKTDKVAWANEGYATSRYWDEVKQQKEETGKTPPHRGCCDIPDHGGKK